MACQHTYTSSYYHCPTNPLCAIPHMPSSNPEQSGRNMSVAPTDKNAVIVSEEMFGRKLRRYAQDVKTHGTAEHYVIALVAFIMHIFQLSGGFFC